MWTPAVIVAALGYFVDVYDLLLFSIVRVKSLKDLGVSDDMLLPIGVDLLNKQMLGMLIGGVLWGIWGDKKGRLSVLFGSIFLYSVANIANGLVHNVELYGWLRFIAGIGLAGELGAGITLVAELLPKEKRGYGTTLVASIGVLGAIVASLVGDLLPWRTSYFVGGGLGLALLVLRVSVRESKMYEACKDTTTISKGNFFMLFSSWERFRRYVFCLFSGLPIWFVLGILVTFAPEVGKELETTEALVAGKAVFWSYVGLTLGDLGSGLISQKLKSRKKVLYLFVIMTAVFSGILINLKGASPALYYLVCVPLGFSIGYWAVFITNAAEQFGTNLRSTVATTAPNFVRGAVVPLTFLFQSLTPHFGKLNAIATTGLIAVSLALISIYGLKESFHKDLDYVEF